MAGVSAAAVSANAGAGVSSSAGALLCGACCRSCGRFAAAVDNFFGLDLDRDFLSVVGGRLDFGGPWPGFLALVQRLAVQPAFVRPRVCSAPRLFGFALGWAVFVCHGFVLALVCSACFLFGVVLFRRCVVAGVFGVRLGSRLDFPMLGLFLVSVAGAARFDCEPLRRPVVGQAAGPHRQAYASSSRP
jgi:hypothetical protein